jgi:hypothetical protein
MSEARAAKVKFAAVSAAFLILCACAAAEMERSPGYELGYSEGCASAAAQGPGVLREPQRNEMLFASDAGYRQGWNAGNVQCRAQSPNRL